MRIVRFIFLVWLVVVTVRFCDVAIPGGQSPFTPGADWLWFCFWTGSVVLVLIAAAIAPSKTKVPAWTLPAAAAAAVLTLSHSWLNALAAVWLTVICAGVGAAVMRRFGCKCSRLEEIVCAVTIGTGITALFVLVCGLLGFLTHAVIWTFLSLVTLLSIKTRPRFLTAPQMISMPEARVLYAIVILVALAHLTWVVAPEIQFDALNYHLAIPQTYLQSSKIVEVPFFHAYFARLIELFMVVCLAIGGAGVAKFWVFLMSVCAVSGVYALGRSVFDERAGLWAAALFATTPLVGWLATTAYVDNVLTLFVTASFIALVRWQRSRETGWLVVAALLAAVAVGSKPIAAFAYVAVAPVVVLRAKTRSLVFASIACALMVLPTYVVTYSFTGNPVFPLLNGFFKSPKWDFTNAIMNAYQFGMATSASSLIRFPFRLILDSSRFGEGLPRGGLGLALLFAFPFALFLREKQRESVKILMLATPVYLLLLFYTMQYGRYCIPILPLVCVIGAATVFALTPPRATRFVSMGLLVVVLVQPLTDSLQFWNLPERFPLSFALGLEDRESFLRRALPGYAAALHLNQLSGVNKVLGLGTEGVRFYLRPELETMPISLQGSTSRRVVDMPPDPSLLAALKQAGFNYLFVTRKAATHPASWYPYLHDDFLRCCTVLEFQEEDALVYRLR